MLISSVTSNANVISAPILGGSSAAFAFYVSTPNSEVAPLRNVSFNGLDCKRVADSAALEQNSSCAARDEPLDINEDPFYLADISEGVWSCPVQYCCVNSSAFAINSSAISSENIVFDRDSLLNNVSIETQDANGVTFESESALVDLGSNGSVTFDLGRRVGLLNNDRALVVGVGLNRQAGNLTSVMLDNPRKEFASYLGVEQSALRFEPQRCISRSFELDLPLIAFRNITIPLDGHDWHCSWRFLRFAGSNNTLLISQAASLRNPSLLSDAQPVFNKTQPSLPPLASAPPPSSAEPGAPKPASAPEAAGPLPPDEIGFEEKEESDEVPGDRSGGDRNSSRASGSSSSSSAEASQTASIVAPTAGGAVLLFLSFLFVSRRRSRKKYQDGYGDSSIQPDDSSDRTDRTGPNVSSNQPLMPSRDATIEQSGRNADGQTQQNVDDSLEIGQDLWVPIDWLDTREPIGSGSFGTVYRALHNDSFVAVKLLPRGTALPRTNSELGFLAQLKHANIVALIGISMFDEQMAIVQEYVSGGTLHDLLHSPQGRQLSLDETISLAIDIAAAFEYLHPGIVHRDLKPQNVLLGFGEHRLQAKVCDFSIARLKERTFLSTLHLQAGTPAYMAPECFQGEAVNERCDQYSFGIVLWEMLTAEEPFSHLEGPLQVIFAVSVRGERPKIPADCPESLKEIISCCWSSNPELRQQFCEIRHMLSTVPECSHF